MINENLIDSVQQLRAYNGMTKGELAKMSGLSVSTISNIEKGKHHPQFKSIEKLSKVFDLSPLDIITGKASLMVSELL